MFELQRKLQDNLATRGKALDFSKATFTDKVKEITTQWRNLTLEFAELLERLPYKEWRTYTVEQCELTSEELLEIKYEYIDMFHFFLNIGLCLDINGEEFEKLYVTKNKENFSRQYRGY
jgi:dimeric dUTPase (all-alpha-NTP-PPase superfamily)